MVRLPAGSWHGLPRWYHGLYRMSFDQTPKKDILVVQGDWNAKVGKDAHEN